MHNIFQLMPNRSHQFSYHFLPILVSPFRSYSHASHDRKHVQTKKSGGDRMAWLLNIGGQHRALGTAACYCRRWWVHLEKEEDGWASSGLKAGVDRCASNPGNANEFENNN
jgi:hypothetical protein